jgi:nucleoside-diphosphate-sugar epimerase
MDRISEDNAGLANDTKESENMLSHYRDRCVLITGGLGFIGSNLAIRLVNLGAKVIIVDSMVSGCGFNLHNLDCVTGRVEVVSVDIADAAQIQTEIRKSDVIFNLAGEISHIHSMQFPRRDLEINCFAQLQFLQECARIRPGIRIVFASTRQVYGIPQYLPVDELHPVNPLDFNGIHKTAASGYHLTMSRLAAIDAVILCLSNVYGPRMALDIPCQGFLGTFLRRALLRQPLELFGDGRQLRDPVYVEDVIEAFLLAGASRHLHSRVYNVGGAKALPLGKIAEIVNAVAGPVPILMRPFPESRKQMDIGSYYTDCRRIGRELGWKATMSFEQGMAETTEYYRSQMCHYLDPSGPEPICKLSEHINSEEWLPSRGAESTLPS